MYTVLLPVDSDETRARQAVDVVTTLPIDPDKTEIIILNVFKEFDVADGDGGVVKSDELFDEDQFPESVQLAASVLEEHGFSPSVHREHGNVVETIIETADDVEADQIVMTGRTRSPVGKAIFGSTIQGVLSAADQPVTITLD